MLKIRNFILFLGIGGSLAGLLLFIVAFAAGEWRQFDDARVTQFYTCPGWDSSTALPMEPMSSFPVNLEQIYVCGYLETRSWARLSFLVFSGNHFVSTLYEEKYDHGYFVVPICSPSPCTLGPGRYRVDVERARDVLGSTEFVVRGAKP